MLYNDDCFGRTKLLQDNSVDLVITSPPYAEQRKDTYGGISEKEYPEWLFKLSKELYRVIKPTGSFVINIKEHVNNGVRSPYVLYYLLKMIELYRWSDTYIWAKINPFPTGAKNRLKDGYEYCFWFTKTAEYKFFPDNVLVPSASKSLEAELKRVGKKASHVTNGSGMSMNNRYASEMVRPSNVLYLATDNSNHEHPAVYPEGLPEFFIKLMTEKGDVVYDPFMGSGTTGIVCNHLDREFIGCEIQKKYFDIAVERVENCF